MIVEVNAAEAAIYGLSAASLLLLIVAAFFVWGSPKAGHSTPHSRHSAAE